MWCPYPNCTLNVTTLNKLISSEKENIFSSISKSVFPLFFWFGLTSFSVFVVVALTVIFVVVSQGISGGGGQKKRDEEEKCEGLQQQK